MNEHLTHQPDCVKGMDEFDLIFTSSACIGLNIKLDICGAHLCRCDVCYVSLLQFYALCFSLARYSFTPFSLPLDFSESEIILLCNSLCLILGSINWKLETSRHGHAG